MRLTGRAGTNFHNPRLILATKSLVSGGSTRTCLEQQISQRRGIMTKTKLTLIAASVGVAIGLFGIKMLIAPPISEAAILASIPVKARRQRRGELAPSHEHLPRQRICSGGE
jgi:hypothetical protein